MRLKISQQIGRLRVRRLCGSAHYVDPLGGQDRRMPRGAPSQNGLHYVMPRCRVRSGDPVILLAPKSERNVR